MNTISLGQLCRWEMRRLRAERTSAFMILLWCGLLMIAAVQGYRQTSARHQEITAVLSADQKAFDSKRQLLRDVEAGRSQPDAVYDPRSPMLLGERPVVLVPSPLSALAAGLGDLAPPVKHSGMLTNLLLPAETIENPANSLAGALDFSFVVSALLPLFVLALGFDVLAREREAKIWPLLASQPVSLRKVMLARLLVQGLALWLPLVLIAGGTVAMSQASTASWVPALAEFALWSGLVGLYLLFWIMLVAAVNNRNWLPASNALALCGVWLAIVLLIPSFIQNVVQAYAPLPDRRAFVLEVRAIRTDLFKRAEQIRDAYHAEDASRRPATGLSEYEIYFAQNLWPRALASEAALVPVLDKLNQQRAAHWRWWRYLAWLSPTLSLRLVTEQLAGVTPAQQGKLLAEAHVLQRRYRDLFGINMASMRKLTLADYDRIPQPVVLFSTFHERYILMWPSVIGLLLVTLLSIFITLRTLRLKSC